MANRSFGTVPAGAPGKPVPFTLNIEEKAIAEFRTLLELSKIGPETWEGKQSKFGTTRDWLINAKDAWLNQFDWRRWEERVNSFPNFKIPIKDSSGEYSIHFAALFSKKADAVPVIFMHGWPGSFLEFLPMLTLLSEKYTPDTLPYHVVVPSLPGYTLSSGGPLDRDFTISDCGRIMNQLMIDLGFGKGYIAQGGDVGSMAAHEMSVSSKECKAIHVNLMMVDPAFAADFQGTTPREIEHLERSKAFRTTGMAYAIEHGTRPSTIGSVLSSNPLALLTWIGEKLIEWADDREPIELDTILGMVSLYWFTETFARSIWPYRGLITGANRSAPTNTEKPLGFSDFPVEIAFTPISVARKIYPGVTYYKHEKGGHFAALEQPKAFLADVEDFVAKHGHVVKG